MPRLDLATFDTGRNNLTSAMQFFELGRPPWPKPQVRYLDVLGALDAIHEIDDMPVPPSTTH
jgi:hypothetical protein